MRKFSPQGDDSDYDFHVEDEGKFWELVRELERTEEPKEIKEKVPKANFCEVCKKKFRSRYHLKLHTPVHTGEKNYNCGICRKSYQQKWNLITHMDRVHAKEKPFKCTECNKTFGYSSHFKRHIKTHFVEKMQVSEEIKRKILNPFSCKHCSKSFDSNYRLRLHTEKHTGNKLFTCDKCGLGFKTKAMVNNHLSEHVNEDCKLWESSEDNPSMLNTTKVHKLSQSAKVESAKTMLDELSPLQKKELIPCEVCGKTMMKESMKKHLNIHYRSRVYNCRYCGKEFLESSQRTVHERRHTGEKPYLCDFCGKRHSQYGNLLTHLMTNHSGEKNSKPHTYILNENVPTMNVPNEENANTNKTNVDDNLELNNPFVLSYVNEYTDETPMISTQVPCTWIVEDVNELEQTKISTVENSEGLPICISSTNIPNILVENITTEENYLHVQNPNGPLKQKNDMMREVKKRMNSNIFEKIVEDLHISNMNAKIKFAVENIRNSSAMADMDPLKEFLKVIKPVPANNVVRRVDGKMRWFCWICNSEFTNRHILARHLIIHEPEEGRPFKCDHCQKTFTQSNNYKEHLMSHNNENQFYCEKCGSGFRHKSHFNNHLRRHSETVSQDKPKKYECLHCDKKFHTNFHRDEHMRTHTREKPYLCKTCGAQFSALSTLNRHAEIHTNARYKCQVCLKLFKQKSSLKRHEAVHSEDRAKKVIACECGKSFSQKSCLAKHKMICKSREGPVDKPFDCSVCSKRFLTNSDLKRHSATHDTTKKYKCDVCSVSLKTGETYLRHVRRHKESETA